MTESAAGGAGAGEWADFRRTPARTQLYVVATLVAAVSLPLVLTGGPGSYRDPWLTVVVLVGASVVNVEIGRRIYGGISHAQQPHKALSGWAFASAALLPAPYLLVVVPITYAHAWWRGLRISLWKWVGSAAFMVLAGLAAASVTRPVVGTQANWMSGDGSRGLSALLLAAVVFLAVESTLLAGSALLNHAADEQWLRRTLSGPSFYLTELGVLLVACLLVAVWTGGPWFVVLLGPIYVMVQRASLLQPMRERAASAARLAEQNQELERANSFKADLVGMLGHEVGNPLTSILGYGQVGREALETGDVDLALRCFEVVERNAAQIERVCADILALATADQGVMTSRLQACGLRPRLLSAAAGQPPGRQPAVECAPDLRAMVQPEHLDQVVSNLLSNAEKYAGGATRLVAEPAGEDRVTVSVVDEGPGVPREFRERLFDRFSREPLSARLAPGTGLGLYITRALARANGGDVVHTAGSPTGSVFTLVLDRADGEDDTGPRPTVEVSGSAAE